MAIILILTLAVLLLAVLVKLIYLNRDIRHLNKTLTHITNTDTNTQLTLKGANKNMAAFAHTINQTLANNRQHRYEKIQTENQLKAAITNISHDLRTPLTSAMGYLQMLPTATPGTQAEYLAIINERLANLATHLTGLFEFARVLEGNTPVNLQPTNICALVENTLAAHYTQLENSGLSIDIHIPATPVHTITDPGILQRILENLLKNAYTHGKDFVRIQVDATGISIANKTTTPLDPSQIFNRFYTADASRSGNTTGIGLAIVAELAPLIHGNVTATVEGDIFVATFNC